MKRLLTTILSLFAISTFGQSLTTIKVSVPNKTDEVYIVGNQESLGNWQANKVKMEKSSDYERSITLELNFPASFKFTKGSWESEGIVKSILNNPNLEIKDKNSPSTFKVLSWLDNLDSEKLGLDYEIKYINSKLYGDKRMLNIYVPENYSPDQKYPVIYLTDGSGTNFPAVKGYVDAFSQLNFKLMPSCIVVGIVHKSRNEELSNLSSGRLFTDYLINEVLPFIDANYNTSGFNTMVGHSNGAEFNHTLLIREDNPFRAFISLSTSFIQTEDVKEYLPTFFNNYKGKKIYYFVANGTHDSPDRLQYGNSFDSLVQKNPNSKIAFKSQTYNANHQTVVPNGLFSGLQHVFKDYNNLDNYPTIYDYAKYYKSNVMENYGIEGQYSRDDIEVYFLRLISTKNKEENEFMIKFINENLLFDGGPLDLVNTALTYFLIEDFEKCIDLFNQALDQVETINPDLYFGNSTFAATKAFKAEGKITEGLDFLVKSRNKMPEKFYLGFTYHIAKYSIENKVDVQMGKNALEYCKNNYRENKNFSMNDLVALEKQLK